jgi:hypothetical protein
MGANMTDERYRKWQTNSAMFIDRAKELVSDSIWKEANLELKEGITWPETGEILDGRAPQGASVEAVLVVNNLKRGWQFLFEQIAHTPKWATVSEYNRIVGEGGLYANPGLLRTSGITITGTDYIPKIPTLDGVKRSISDILAIRNDFERGFSAFAVSARGQWFNNGNKRSAQLFANHILIQNRCGILSVPPKFKTELGALLVDYYETGKTSKLFDFLYDNCLNRVTWEVDNAGEAIVV